jgi:hypothetical protein
LPRGDLSSRQKLGPHIADSGRYVRGRGDPNGRPNGPGEARPARFDGVAGSTHAGGDLVTRNPAGQPTVTAIGQSRPTKPMQTGKSKIVPEPDQIQSPPPGPRRRASMLEPPGT